MHRSRLLCAVPALALALVAAGCGNKNAPVTAAEPPVDVEPATRAASDVPPEPPSQPAEEADIWSADLETLNAHAREHGLLQTVYFDFDRSELGPDARQSLAANARFLQERPELIVAIEGHADERGTGEYNLALGDKRAQTVRGYLGSLGVNGERTRPVSYGEERPECTRSAEDCWWKNRRAAFVIVGRHSG